MSTIEASELILNKRGAIYHLDLLPGEIADTVITVGDPARVEKISRHFDGVSHKKKQREFVTHTGRLGQKTISVMSTGIGPDNIDIALTELDALFNIDFHSRTEKKNRTRLNIIRIGTCGSLQADVECDSIVASTHAIGLDNLMHFYPFRMDDHEQSMLGAFRQQIALLPALQPYCTTADPHLLAAFASNCHAGITVTCPGFYAPQGRNLRSGLSMPALNTQLSAFRWSNMRILNFEMETAAIYALGKLLGHQCLSLSTIVANRQAKTFSEHPDAAIERLIQHVLRNL